ncbi:MAG: ZIP family metal transporter [Candidatus Margulisiibacteriota bacterium]
MPVIVWILLATITVSLISLVGVISLSIKGNLLQRILLLLVGFSAGTLIGGAFLHLLPETLERLSTPTTFLFVLIGFSFFFIMERVLFWRHCHDEHCSYHSFTYLNLYGDGIHNFLDGLIIAGSFVAGIPVGIATTLAVITHEIPQELGEFGVLIYGGFSKMRALFFNLLSALMAVAGGIIGYYLSLNCFGFDVFLLPFTAGGFIYIGASDLIPELHKEKVSWKSNLAFASFLLGLLFMWGTKQLLR